MEATAAWVCKARESLPGTREGFESMWQKLEAASKERQSAE
ncbi:hypothetical protein [Streptomyces sp. NPDC088141]